MAIAVGIAKGHKTTPIKRVRVNRKGVRGPQRALTQEVIRECCGYAPYERRALELLRNGFDKRALRLCKRKLGTVTRGKAKREELNNLMQKARRERAAHAHAGKEHEHHDHFHEVKTKKMVKKEKAEKKVKA